MAENNLTHGSTGRTSGTDWNDNQSRYERERENDSQRTGSSQNTGTNRENEFEQNRGGYGSSWSGSSNRNEGWGQTPQQSSYNRGSYGNQSFRQANYGSQEYGNPNFNQNQYGNQRYGNQQFGHTSYGESGSNPSHDQPNYGNMGYGSQGNWNDQGYAGNRSSYRSQQDFENDRYRSASYGNQNSYGNNPSSGNYGSDYNRGQYSSNQGGYLGSASSGYGSDFDRSGYDRYATGYGFNSPNYDSYNDRGWSNRPEHRTSYGRYGNEGYTSTNYGRRDSDHQRGTGNYGQERNWWDRATDEVSSWFGDSDAERRRNMDRAQDHRGRGPRGYQRSDERIKEDINDRLSDDSFVDASEVNVDVTRGEVVLTGTVDNRMAKRRAEDLAEAISGVRNVENRIRVTDYTSYGDSMRSGTASSSTTTGNTSATSTTGSTSSADKNKRS